MAQLVKHPALDFSSGNDLMVHGIKPHIRLCADSTEHAWDPLFPSLSAPPLLACSLSKLINELLKIITRGAWVAQLVKRPTLAQVMISRFMGSSPTLGSVLIAQSLEPASTSVSLSPSARPLLMLCVSLSLKNK